MERQAKDGTFYRKVGTDEWEIVTRSAKDGTVYKKVGKDEWEPLSVSTRGREAKKAGFGEKAHAAIEGFAQSASLGTLPYLKAGADYLTDVAAGIPEEARASFDERVERARAQGQGVRERAPGYALAGDLAGFAAPGLGAAKLIRRGTQVLGHLAPRAAQAMAARPLAAQAARMGAEGALIGAAYTPESGFTDVGARLEGATTGAVFGAAIPPALRAGGKVLKGVANIPKKFLSALGGVSDDVIDRYLANPERINNAKTFDELYEQVTGIVRKMGDDLDSAKIDYNAAKAHLDDIADGIRNSRIEGKEKALREVQGARSVLDEAFGAQKESLKRKASPSTVEPMVSDALDSLKKAVSRGSKEATEALGKETVDVSSTYKSLVSSAQEMAERGSDSARQAVTKLQQYGKLIFDKGSTDAKGKFRLPSKEVKKLIQDIDNDINSWNAATGSFDDAYNASLKTLRRSLDEQLKSSSPEYAQRMSQVAEDARLLGQASERFGKPDRALSRLSNLERPAAKYDKEVLTRLADREGGGELPRAISEMTEAQRTLRSPTRLEGLKQSLPEAQTLRAAEMEAARARRLAKPKLVKEAIKKSAATFKEQSAKARLEKQKELFNRFRSFGEQTAENKLKQVARGRKHAEKVLRELSEYADEDLVEAVKAAQDAVAFEKTAFHGSRNVNLWAVLGSMATGRGGAGAAAGGLLGGPVGIALGAVVGGMIDVYGPRLTKRILDGVVKIKGPITSSKILKLNLPKNIKDDLISSFRATVLTSRAASKAQDAGRLVAEKKDAPKRGPERWANDGFDKVIKSTDDQARVRRYRNMKDEIMRDTKARSLLAQASSLSPQSKAFKNIMRRLDDRLKERGK